MTMSVTPEKLTSKTSETLQKQTTPRRGLPVRTNLRAGAQFTCTEIPVEEMQSMCEPTQLGTEL
jgi:hypothetical protein